MGRTDTDTGSSHSRRRFLEGVGATVTAGMAVIGGCASVLPSAGQQIEYGRVDTPPRGDPHYLDWVPRPSALRDPDNPSDDVSTLYTTPGNLGRETLGAEFTLGRSLVVSGIDYLGVGIDNYDWALLVDRDGAVLKGDFERDHVDRTLTDTVYERTTSYEGYDLYRRNDEEKLVAVSASTIVATAGSAAPQNTRAIIDAGEGQIERYHESDPSVASRYELWGASPFTWAGLEDPLGVAQTRSVDAPSSPIDAALSFTFDETTGYFIRDILFPDGETPSVATVRERLEADTSLASRARLVDIEIDDPRVTVEIQIADDAFEAFGGSVHRRPQITWRSTYDEATDSMQIEHVAGDKAVASTIHLRPEQAIQSRIAERYDILGPGDRIPVDRPGSTRDLSIVWESPDGEQSSVLYEFSFPPVDPESDESVRQSGASTATSTERKRTQQVRNEEWGIVSIDRLRSRTEP